MNGCDKPKSPEQAGKEHSMIDQKRSMARQLPKAHK